MFFLEESTQDNLFQFEGGRVRSTLGEVYRTQREADRLGGQSWSEVRELLRRVDEQAARVEELTGEAPVAANPLAMSHFLNGETDEFRRLLEARTPRGTGFVINDIPTRQEYEFLINNADQVVSQHAALKQQFPDAGIQTIDEMRDEIAQVAREQFDAAQEVAGRASGGTRFFGQAGAGVVQAVNEPANIFAAVMTAPIAVEALGTSLLARLAGLAVFEGSVSGLSEYAIQQQLEDFYRRQGFTEDEISQRQRDAVAGAVASGALLAPGLFLVGKGVGAAVTPAIRPIMRRLASGNAQEVLSAADELAAQGLSRTPSEQATVDILRRELSLEQHIPSNWRRSPDNARLLNDLVDAATASLERGSPTTRYAQLQNPAVALRETLQSTTAIRTTDVEGFDIRGIDTTADPLLETRSRIRGVKDTSRFIDRRTPEAPAAATLDPQVIADRVKQALSERAPVVSRLDQPTLNAVREADTQQALLDALDNARVRYGTAGTDLRPLTRQQKVEALQELGFQGQRETIDGRTGARVFRGQQQREFLDSLNLPNEARALVEDGVPLSSAISTTGSRAAVDQATPNTARLNSAEAGEFDELVIREARDILNAKDAAAQLGPDEAKAFSDELAEIESDEQGLRDIVACIGV